MGTLTTLLGAPKTIYIIISIAIPIIILLIYIKLCLIDKGNEDIIKQQDYTNELLAKQIQQNEEIKNILIKIETTILLKKE